MCFVRRKVWKLQLNYVREGGYVNVIVAVGLGVSACHSAVGRITLKVVERFERGASRSVD